MHNFTRKLVVSLAGTLTSTLQWLLALPQTRLGFKQLLHVQIFALLYVIYTMIRAATAGWHPFFNPENVGGYGGAATC